MIEQLFDEAAFLRLAQLKQGKFSLPTLQTPCG